MAKLQPRKVSSGKGRAVIGGICCILMFVILIFGILAVYKSEQREIEIVAENTLDPTAEFDDHHTTRRPSG